MPGQPVVNIYAKKGDNYIHLQGFVFDFQKVQTDAEKKCNFPTNFDINCWDQV